MKAEKINVQKTRFISDHHFCHDGVIAMAGRPFRDADEMDRYMITAWNAVVEDDVHVWHLGDFGNKADRARLSRVFRQLKGIKHLIVGNHDDEFVRSKDFGWASVQDRKILNAGGQILVLDHYPSREWYGWWRGSLLLHGHTHNNIPSSSRSFDCSVDNLGYVPATYTEIQTRMDQLPHLDFRYGTEVDWLVAPREPPGRSSSDP